MICSVCRDHRQNGALVGAPSYDLASNASEAACGPLDAFAGGSNRSGSGGTLDAATRSSSPLDADYSSGGEWALDADSGDGTLDAATRSSSSPLDADYSGGGEWALDADSGDGTLDADAVRTCRCRRRVRCSGEPRGHRGGWYRGSQRRRRPVLRRREPGSSDARAGDGRHPHAGAAWQHRAARSDG